jgi:hypothetical protein
MRCAARAKGLPKKTILKWEKKDANDKVAAASTVFLDCTLKG